MFQGTFTAYNRAFEEGKQLRSRNFLLEQQQRRANPYTVGGKEEGDQAALEEQLRSLQQELTGSYRLQAENAQTLIRLKDQTVQDETGLLKKDQELTAAKGALATLTEERVSDAEKIRKLQSNLDVLHNEYGVARAHATTSDQKSRALEAENHGLVERLMTLKDHQAHEINEMNSLVISAKAKSGREAGAGEAGGIQPNLDLSNHSAILDAGAWRSYFDVSVPTGKKLAFKAHAGGAATLRFNPKGTLLVTGGMDTMVKIWNAKTGAPLATLSSSKQPITCVTFSNDDQHILATGNDKIARVWSMKTSRVRHTLVGHSSKIYAATFLPLDEYFVTGSHDMCVKVWEMAKGTCVRSIPCHSSVNSLSVSPGKCGSV
jgi:autophagy-related protein 16